MRTTTEIGVSRGKFNICAKTGNFAKFSLALKVTFKDQATSEQEPIISEGTSAVELNFLILHEHFQRNFDFWFYFMNEMGQMEMDQWRNIIMTSLDV